MPPVTQNQAPMQAPRHPVAVIEILDASLDAADKVDNVNKVFRVIAGSEAFRRYDWLRNVPATNVAGNFRGMVVNAKWKTAFQFSNKIGEGLDAAGNALVLASLAVNLYKAKDRIAQILSSNTSDTDKAARLSAYTSSLILATLGGAVPAGAHLLAMSLEGYLMLAQLSTGGRLDTAGAVNKLRSLDANVGHAYNTVADGDQLFNFIDTYLVYASPKFLKF